MNTATATDPTWDLEPIFPGDCASPEFVAFRGQLKDELAAAEKEIAVLPEKLTESNRVAWSALINQLQRIGEHVRHAYSFAHCLTSANVDDRDAQQAEVDLASDYAVYANLMTGLESLAAAQPDDCWELLFADDKMQAIRFSLDEMRLVAREKLPLEQESLINDLAVEGYHGWNRLYEKMSGGLRADFVNADGKTEQLSFGQISNKMSSPDRTVRQQAFEAINTMWQPMADLAAMTLNSQAGFRLALYKRRGWDSILKEPLILCRTKQESLEAMWGAVSREVNRLKPYIEAKKKLLGADRFMWYDQNAPVGESKEKLTFEYAGDFIVDNLRTFSPEMADFSRMALDKRWVEAEDRPGKRAGGYCTSFGDVRQTRIFMTYSPSYTGLRTLAHELGHSWHSWTLRNEEYFATHYALNIAEGASTFNELLVADAALEQSDDHDTRLMLLDQKLTNALAFMCNIHARYLFDLEFYGRRKNGMVSRSDLSAIMVEAQKKAFGDLLDPDGYHELFWATKLHFFLTAQPFYNFPYTYGYLFSNGIYDRAKAEGPAFADGYKALLRDTGRMDSEDLAQKHLGVDLTKEDFWKSALDRILVDVDKFVKLAG